MGHGDFSILVVDDEPEMKEMLADYLRDVEGYKVFTAQSGREALDSVLPGAAVDLVLSDINMPEMKGFELLNEVRVRYPTTKRMLITAYNVEDYLDLALKYDVGNIFVKTTPFNFTELSTAVDNLLTNNIFGAERYFEKIIGRANMMVRTADTLNEHAQAAIAMVKDRSREKKLELVIVELLTNAIFYGVRNEVSDDKGAWDHSFSLSDAEAVILKVMYDTEKYAISIIDNGGRLSKKEVLYWLGRQTIHDEKGLPLGILDTHGRGLFIARKYIDRLIINIDRNRKTELIIINYLANVYKGSKPLYINEI
jgi:CheY-like chemotaxis protein